MPQASEELRAKWNGPDEQTAMKHLRSAGYVLTRRWTWVVPVGKEPTEDDYSAMQFLVDEWDFAGFERPASPTEGESRD